MVNEIGKRISSIRKSKNISQDELAEKLGVTRQAISKWERGEGLPDLYNTISLANEFNLSLDELVLGRKQNKSNKQLTKSRRKSWKLIYIGSFLGILGLLLIFMLPNMLVDTFIGQITYFELRLIENICIITGALFILSEFVLFFKAYWLWYYGEE